MIFYGIVTIVALLLSTVQAAKVFNLNLFLALAVVVCTEFFVHVLLRLVNISIFTNWSIALVSCSVWLFFSAWRIAQVGNEAQE